MPYIDGILYEFNRAMNHAVIKRIAKSNKNASVIIPHNVQGFPVKHIDAHAFDGHTLRDITLPHDLETIGNHAFANCKSLKKVMFTSGKVTIYTGAFYNCPNLEEINSVRLTTIQSAGHSIFSCCHSLKNIWNLEFVGMIYDCTFERCSHLEEIWFGHNTEIKNGALKGCKALKTLHLDGNIAIPSKAMKKQMKAYKLVCTEVTTILDWAYEGYCIEIDDDCLPF